MTTGGFDPNQDPHSQGNDPDNPDPKNPPGGYPPPPSGGYPPPQGNYPPPPGNYPPPQGNYPPPPGNYPPPQGNYPPPPGNYPPPQGNYPPPPGNYPPPPPGNFSSQPGYSPAPTRLSVGDAISYGWSKFSANAGVWIGFMLVAIVIEVVINFIFGGFDTSADFTLWRAIGSVVAAIVSYLIQAAYVRGALHETDGIKPAFGSFFQFDNVAAVIIASVIVGLATTIGFVLLIIPGLVIMFLTWWTLPFVIDRNEDPIAAIKSSVRAISSNVGTLLLLALAVVGLNLVGLLLCGLGLFVSVPVTIIASTYAYRVTTGGPVAP